MVNRFRLKTLFSHDEISHLVDTYGFRRMSTDQVQSALESAFSDYILVALTEQNGDDEEQKQIYLESNFHLQKASKLLSGMPHPAGKMAFRLNTMISTLQKLIEGDHFSAERASRFTEKNLIRRLRDLWQQNTSTPFHVGGDASGRNPRDFLLQCFQAAATHYPEIHWFHAIDRSQADELIKSIKR